jgi:hypothetical protein
MPPGPRHATPANVRVTAQSATGRPPTATSSKEPSRLARQLMVNVVHLRVRHEDRPCYQLVTSPLYAERHSQGPRDDIPRSQVSNLSVLSLLSARCASHRSITHGAWATSGLPSAKTCGPRIPSTETPLKRAPEVK